MKKKKIIYFLTAIMLVGVAFAAWQLFLQSQITGHVISGAQAPARFWTEFDTITLDTTTAPDTQSQTAMLRNNDGPLEMIFNVTENKLDFDDACFNYENDCSFSYNFEGSPVNNGDVVILPSGDSYVTATVSCVAYSCPQDFNLTVSFQG